MNSLSGARKLCTSMLSSGAISVSMSITGTPESIIFFTGAVSVPMPNAWIATKSHFWLDMFSTALRCLVAFSSPSNQVTSTLNILPHHSAACLPWAHQVACSPALEKAALSGFSERPVSRATDCAMAGLMPKPPSRPASIDVPAACTNPRRSAPAVMMDLAMYPPYAAASCGGPAWRAIFDRGPASVKRRCCNVSRRQRHHASGAGAGTVYPAKGRHAARAGAGTFRRRR